MMLRKTLASMESVSAPIFSDLDPKGTQTHFKFAIVQRKPRGNWLLAEIKACRNGKSLQNMHHYCFSLGVSLPAKLVNGSVVLL